MAVSAFGVEHGGYITKADRRFKLTPNTKAPLYLARHSTEAASIRQAAIKPKNLKPAAAIRAGLRTTAITVK